MEERLITFLTAAQFGSFQDTAAALGVAPSTVTDRVKRLESDLGCTLFHRLPRALQVTQAGRVFLRHAQRTLEAIEEGRRAVEAIGSAAAGGARIVCSAVPAFGALPRLCRSEAVAARAADVSCWTITTSKRAFRAMLEDKADVGIVNIRFRHPELETELLAEERFQVVAATGSGIVDALDRHGPAGADQQLLYFREELEDSLRAQMMCAHLGWPAGRSTGVTDLGVLLELLLQGCGAGIVQASVTSRSAARGLLERWNGEAARALPGQVTCLLVRRAVASERRFESVQRFVRAVRDLYRTAPPASQPDSP